MTPKAVIKARVDACPHRMLTTISGHTATPVAEPGPPGQLSHYTVCLQQNGVMARCACAGEGLRSQRAAAVITGQINELRYKSVNRK